MHKKSTKIRIKNTERTQTVKNLGKKKKTKTTRKGHKKCNKNQLQVHLKWRESSETKENR